LKVIEVVLMDGVMKKRKKEGWDEEGGGGGAIRQTFLDEML